jgi:hypothetical protein
VLKLAICSLNRSVLENNNQSAGFTENDSLQCEQKCVAKEKIREAQALEFLSGTHELKFKQTS